MISVIEVGTKAVIPFIESEIFQGRVTINHITLHEREERCNLVLEMLDVIIF